jgi:hypothetical protein
MAPTPVKFGSLQPFATIRDNWGSVKLYHDNYIRTVSLASVLTGFLGTLALIIKHGFKFPILHPKMAEDIEPSDHLSHPNEYVSEEDLVEARLFELEQEERWRIAEELEREEQRKKEQEEEEQRKQKAVDGAQTQDEEGEDPVTIEAEEGLQEQLQDGVENALDILDDEGEFDGSLDKS